MEHFEIRKIDDNGQKGLFSKILIEPWTIIDVFTGEIFDKSDYDSKLENNTIPASQFFTNSTLGVGNEVMVPSKYC